MVPAYQAAPRQAADKPSDVTGDVPGDFSRAIRALDAAIETLRGQLGREQQRTETADARAAQLLHQLEGERQRGDAAEAEVVRLRVQLDQLQAERGTLARLFRRLQAALKREKRQDG
jgi:hypothetical protein